MDHREALIDAPDMEADEFARLNMLTVDSQYDMSLLFAQFENQTTDLDELGDDASLFSIPAASLDHRAEQPDVSKSSIELLADATALGRENNHARRYFTSRELAKLKLEPPLLHDYGCRELVRNARERRKANIELVIVPLEPLNTSNDESLDYAERDYEYRQKLITEINDEKMDVSKETLHYLCRALRHEWTHDQQSKLMDELIYRKGLRASCVTPPLSPAPQNEDYFIPDEEVCRVPVSSDPSTLLDEDLSRAEAFLLEQGGDQIIVSSPLHFETPNLSPGELSLLERNAPSLESLKIEGPLTPQDSIPPFSDLVVDIPALTSGIDIDQVTNEGQANPFDADGEKDWTDVFNDDALAALKEKAESVRREVEQEQLQAADAIARIEIPKLDFSFPEPGWQKVPLDASLQLAWIEKTHAGFNVPPWPKNSKEEKDLRWFPFDSRIGRISINESIDIDKDAEALLSSPDNIKVLTSADYVWKQPGLAILREEDEEDEHVKPLSMDEDRDIGSLIRKRKLELESLELEHGNHSDSVSPIDLIKIPGNEAPPSFQAPPSGHGKLPRLLLDCDDPSATSTLLSNYVDFHTAKRRKQDKSSFFQVPNKPATQAEVAAASKNAVAMVKHDTAAERKSEPEQVPEQEPASSAPAPCPKLQLPAGRTRIIKALTLSRNIFSLLEKFYPNAEIIERDFDRWNTLTWDRNSVSRSPVASPLAAEADVIVSPATGIVVTTLLKAMQKAPPGHKGLPAIRERVRGVAARYERLIILVSEANRVDETARELTPSECAGFADFTGFVAGLDAGAQTYYIGGGDETLAKWLVAFAVRYAPEAADAQDMLIQDETLWELFLRRAGMNAYAAQAILGKLKAPEGTPEEEVSQYGLSAFVRMTPVERVQDFGRLMGGESVLNRVNEVLETRWS